MSHPLKLVLWSREGCSACQEAKAYFQSKGYIYENIDVTGRDHLRDILELKYGIRHVPVIEIGDGVSYEAITDRNFQKIDALLA